MVSEKIFTQRINKDPLERKKNYLKDNSNKVIMEEEPVYAFDENDYIVEIDQTKHPAGTS